MDKKFYMHFDVTIKDDKIIISEDSLTSREYFLTDWEGDRLVDTLENCFRDYLITSFGLDPNELTKTILRNNDINKKQDDDYKKLMSKYCSNIEMMLKNIKELRDKDWKLFDIADCLGIPTAYIVDMLRIFGDKNMEEAAKKNEEKKNDGHKDFVRIVNSLKMHGWPVQQIAEHYSVPKSLVIDALKESENDPVNHPSHYTDGKIEVIDFITDKNLNFQLGNTVKYICRAGKKDPSKTIEDLKKAQWYLNQWIAHLEKETD